MSKHDCDILMAISGMFGYMLGAVSGAVSMFIALRKPHANDDSPIDTAAARLDELADKITDTALR